ncbi:MAG TPA: hypothetical protein DCP28_37600 [Cytophagales bacterium]|nr:hypothetical protein [Cytophagales bacterium]
MVFLDVVALDVPCYLGACQGNAWVSFRIDLPPLKTVGQHTLVSKAQLAICRPNIQFSGSSFTIKIMKLFFCSIARIFTDCPWEMGGFGST